LQRFPGKVGIPLWSVVGQSLPTLSLSVGVVSYGMAPMYVVSAGPPL
jgi:hypothetical protein